jgi:hypothetical protein
MYRASIYGRPIVLDLNRSCFLRDEGEIERRGTAALNVTGAYFSDYEINGKRQYEDWTSRELAERTQDRREFTVKTHRGLFHARVGSAVRIATSREQLTGKITGFHFCYRKNKAFQATFHILENKE